MKALRIPALLALSLGLSVGALAIAVAGEQATGTGTPRASFVLGVTTTSTCVKANSSSQNCMLFPASSEPNNTWKLNTVFLTAMSGTASCCWTLKIDSDVDPATEEIASTGKGPCFPIPSYPAFISTRPDYEYLFSHGGGTQTGICSLPVDTDEHGLAGDDGLYAPCASAQTCLDNHAIVATCTAHASRTQAQKFNIGAYLVCESGSSGSVHGYKDKAVSL